MSSLEELFAEMGRLQHRIQAQLGYPLENDAGDIILEADIVAGSMIKTDPEISYKPRNPTAVVQCMHGTSCYAMGIDWVGSQCLCSRHLTDLLQPMYERLIVAEHLDGVVVQDGVLRPEYGPLGAECRCTSCSMTLVWRIGYPCPACEATAKRLTAEQADLLLEPPDIDPHDVNYEVVMRSWAKRMARGIEAGVTDEWSTAAAWRRAVNDVAAA